MKLIFTVFLGVFSCFFIGHVAAQAGEIYALDEDGRPIPVLGESLPGSPSLRGQKLDISETRSLPEAGQLLVEGVEKRTAERNAHWNCGSGHENGVCGKYLSHSLAGPDLIFGIFDSTWKERQFNVSIEQKTYDNGEVIETGTVEGVWAVAWRYICPKPWAATLVYPTVDQSVAYAGCRLSESNERFCPAGYIYDSQRSFGQRCKAVCATGSIWSEALQSCLEEPKKEDCETQSGHPIDFIAGKKYRKEPVITSGSKYPFSFFYFYNSQNGSKGTAAGRLWGGQSYKSPSAIRASISREDYYQQYDKKGFALVDSTVLPDQYYGGISSNWRHNFDDVLQIRGQTYILHTAKGAQITFNGFGNNQAYEHLDLSRLSSGEESFSGYKIIDHRNNNKKVFDDTGKLRKIYKANKDVLSLVYENNLLKEIVNIEGAKIIITDYDIKREDLVYAYSGSLEYLPARVENSMGLSAEIAWDHSSSSNFQYVRTINSITRITEPSAADPVAARDFEYDNYSGYLTDIYIVEGIPEEIRTLYAHFDYDIQTGNAIYSGLSGGKEAISVQYPDDLTRIVTNALGKDTTYRFDYFNGVKKLKSIVGEPINSCLQSNVTYDYPEPNKKLRTQNGVTTEILYNNKGQIQTQTEAKGTIYERTVQTCWHSSFDKPERIIEPDRVTMFDYFPSGKLKFKKVLKRDSNNSVCP